MINFLSSWVKNLSLALIIVSILEMILPNSKTKKYIKMIMGLYILFSIISPFIDSSKLNLENIDLNFYEDMDEQASTTEVDQTSMDIRLSQLYGEELEKDIKTKVEEKGYNVKSCKVTAKITEKESKIEKIILDIDKKTEENKQENENSIENKIVTEIQKIQKVQVGNSKNNEEKNEEESLITKTDKNIIKQFLIEEYGVNEECLKIN